MNELQIFEQREVLGKDFKIYGTPDEPLFLARDVSEWIDYSKTSKGAYDVSKMLNPIDDNEKLIRTIFVSGQNREMWFLTEDGLYEVLMQSRKPIAKEFKAKVKEILKSIRKHGAYMTPAKIEEILLNPDTIITLATALKEEQTKNTQLQLENKIKDEKIAEMQPKANYVDMILKSPSLIKIKAIAKDYGMTAQMMNITLRDLKVQYKEGSQWFLYRKYQDKGYTQSETYDFKYRDGAVGTRLDTKWTQKGRLFIYEVLKSQGILPTMEREIVAAQKGA